MNPESVSKWLESYTWVQEGGGTDYSKPRIRADRDAEAEALELAVAAKADADGTAIKYGPVITVKPKG